MTPTEVTSQQIHAFRAAQAEREAPGAIVLTGAVAGPLFLGAFAARGFVPSAIDVVHAVILVILVVAWAVVRSRWLPPAAVPWLMAGVGVTAVALMLAVVVFVGTPVTIAAVILVMIAYSPFVLDPFALAVSVVPVLAGYVVVVAGVEPADALQWYIVGVSATAIGVAVLRVRLIGIDALARSSTQVHDVATRDFLTGALNRQGLAERVPALVSAAVRRQEIVFVVFVDIDGLKVANDTCGHEVGDAAIVLVADALRSVARAGDLVVRWGGDEFLVVGSGESTTANAWEARLDASLASAGGPGGWSRHVTVGTAAAPAADLAFDDLTRAADEAMYARRRARRGGP